MSGRGPVTGLPSSDAVPVEVLVRPETILSNVDLPHPDGPTIETNWPVGTSRETCSRAVTCVRFVVNRTPTSSRRTAGTPATGAADVPGRVLMLVLVVIAGQRTGAKLEFQKSAGSNSPLSRPASVKTSIVCS